MENTTPTNPPTVNLTPELPSAFDLLKPSWQALKLNIVTFIELIIIPAMFSLLGTAFSKSSLAISIVFRLIGLVAGLVLAPALIITQLKSVKGETIDFSPAVLQGLKFFWRYLGLSICLAIIIGVGFILLIVPGFFMLRRYILAPFYLIDQNLSITEALKVSAEQSKQFSSAVWGLIAVTLLFAILCIILIGIVLSVMYYCAPAIRYFEIKEKAGSKPAEPVAPAPNTTPN